MGLSAAQPDSNRALDVVHGLFINMLTIESCLRSATEKLQQQLITTAKLDAELLLAYVLQLSRTQLRGCFDELISVQHQQLFQQLIQRRLSGEPVAYILGEQEFWSLSLRVTPATLIPRPETELLVELILNNLPSAEPLKIADLGTGSGAIAIAIAKERPHWQIYATDFSEAALAIAQENAKRWQLQNIRFFVGDWCAALPASLKLAAIVSNPPYIAANDQHLSALQFEPQSALVSGTDGLTAIRKIAVQAHNYLCPDAQLFMEHGYDQAESARAILIQQGYLQVTTHLDLNKLARVVSGRFLGK